MKRVSTFLLWLVLDCLPGKSDVFVHVECDDMLEGELASLVELDQVPVDSNGRGTCRKSKDKRLGRSRVEFPDTLLDVLGFMSKNKRESQY